MDRKKEIINATLELAAENGLGTVSMQQIADKMGITKASIARAFFWVKDIARLRSVSAVTMEE